MDKFDCFQFHPNSQMCEAAGERCDAFWVRVAADGGRRCWLGPLGAATPAARWQPEAGASFHRREACGAAASVNATHYCGFERRYERFP